MSTHLRSADRYGALARAFESVIALVVLTMLAGLPRAAEMSPADCCAAVKEYQETQQWEQEAKAKLDKIQKPSGTRLKGTVAEWHEMIRNLKAQQGYMSLQQIDQRTSYIEVELREDNSAVKSLNRDINTLSETIGNLKAKQRGSDDENQKAEIQKQIEAKQKELKSKQSEVGSLKVKIKDLDLEQQKLNDAVQAAAIVDNMEKWIPYAGAEEEWKIASDDLKKAREKSDAATVAKNEALNGAKSKFNEEQQRIKSTTADLQGAAKDEAYYEKLSQMTSHGRATLQFILLSLSNFDCFPDVKSYMGDIEARLKRLEATRQTILAQAAALSTKPTSPRIAQNPPPDKPRVRKPSVVKPRAKTPLPKPKTKPAKTKTLNFNYTGSWRSSEGSLTLTQNGNAISGQWTLPFNNRVRQISGTAQSDGSVTGTWTDEYASGTFFWKWSREFRGDQVVFRFRGEFRQNERTRRWVGIKR